MAKYLVKPITKQPHLATFNIFFFSHTNNSMSSRNQFRKNIGSVGPIGEPFLNGVPHFGGNFTIPFALCDKDEYLLWLFHVIGQIRSQYGPHITKYIVEYIHGNDVLEELPIDLAEQIMIRNLAKTLIRVILAYGVCIIYNQQYCDLALGPLDCLRKFHQNFCKYELSDVEEWFSNWAVIMTKLRAEGEIEVYEFSKQINGFTDEELELFDNMSTGLYDKKGLIRRYFQGLDSDVLDLYPRAAAFLLKDRQPILFEKAIDLSWFLSKPLSEAVGPEEDF